MKRILLPLLLLLCTTQLFASLRQTKYRWRNDDGSETTATWKAAENTAILVNDTGTLRLRIELDNDNEDGDISVVENQLEYSSDNGTSWIPMSNSPGQAFAYQSSTNVANALATTNQMGSGTFGTFVAGHVVSAFGPSSMSLNDGERTELEWVIRPTFYAQPNTTYIFQVSGLEDGALTNPTVNTGCIGIYIVSKKDSARCGPGIIKLSAASTSNAVVQWYDSPSGGTLLDTGTTFITPLLNTTKIYYVSAKMGTTCESARIAVTATINPIPTVNLGNDVSGCEGDPLVLNAGGSYTYLWDNGSTNITRTVTTAGSYFVTVTGIGNCKKADTIAVNYNPRPLVDLGADTLICPGVKVTFDAGNPGDTYLWDGGSTGRTLEVSSAGDYSVAVTNQFNCTGTDVVNVIVKDMPLGEINAVHGDTATYTFSVINALYAVDYIWDFGDGTPPVNGFMQTHTYAKNNIYLVKLTMLGDCDTNSQRERTVDVYDVMGGGTTGINNPSLSHAISIYPNPAKEMIYLSLKADVKVNGIDIFNILGQHVSAVKQPSKVTSIGISTASLPNGIYSMRINTDKGFIVQKFEVRK